MEEKGGGGEGMGEKKKGREKGILLLILFEYRGGSVILVGQKLPRPLLHNFLEAT